MDKAATSLSPRDGLAANLPGVSSLTAQPHSPVLPAPGGGRHGGLRALLETRETPLSRAIICVALWSVCVYLLITNFVGGTIEVQGESMWPTLRPGDTYLMNRWACRFRAPQRGEFVIFHDPGHEDLAIKRVIATEGERVEIHDSAVFVDGLRLREPYLASGTRTYPAQGMNLELIVPKGCIFVLGDNRGNSVDSRFYGAVSRDRIVGLVTPN